MFNISVSPNYEVNVQLFVIIIRRCKLLRWAKKSDMSNRSDLNIPCDHTYHVTWVFVRRT